MHKLVSTEELQTNGTRTRGRWSDLLFNVLGVTQCLKLAIEMQAVALLSIFQGTNTVANVMTNATKDDHGS